MQVIVRLLTPTSLLMEAVVNLRLHPPGDASPPAALLLLKYCPIFSVVAPGHPGAALRDLGNESRFQGTSAFAACLAWSRQQIA